MKKKSIATIATSVALIASLAVGGSLAYFTDSEQTDNTFTVGNVKIELTEPGWTGYTHVDGHDILAEPGTVVGSGSWDAATVYAGEPLAKDPTVKNSGENPCFVRIKVTGLDQFGSEKMITYRTDHRDGKLGDQWVDGGDGYFYYKEVLLAGASTNKLFEQIAMPTTLTGTETVDEPITVYAQAVQAQGARPSFANVLTMTVSDIAEWFSSCGMVAPSV